jgi:hypothetical protein
MCASAHLGKNAHIAKPGLYAKQHLDESVIKSEWMAPTKRLLVPPEAPTVPIDTIVDESQCWRGNLEGGLSLGPDLDVKDQVIGQRAAR